jgi:hypothetical protein
MNNKAELSATYKHQLFSRSWAQVKVWGIPNVHIVLYLRHRYYHTKKPKDLTPVIQFCFIFFVDQLDGEYDIL